VLGVTDEILELAFFQFLKRLLKVLSFEPFIVSNFAESAVAEDQSIPEPHSIFGIKDLKP